MTDELRELVKVTQEKLQVKTTRRDCTYGYKYYCGRCGKRIKKSLESLSAV